jgi:hypothetical protein
VKGCPLLITAQKGGKRGRPENTRKENKTKKAFWLEISKDFK